MKGYILCVIILCCMLPAKLVRAQIANVSNPDPSAELEIRSTQGGVLFPRMTAGQRTSITSPGTGLLVYDTDSAAFMVYTGSAWTKIMTSAEDKYWVKNGNNISGSNSGNVGIGTATPQAKAQIQTNSTPAAPQLKLTEAASGNHARLVLDNTASGKYWTIAGLNGTGTNADDRLGIYHSGGGQVMEMTGDGNIGIGTATPQAKQEVSSASSVTNPQLMLTETAVNEYARITLRNTQASNNWTVAGMATGNRLNDRFNIYHSTAGDVISIDGWGNTGIGSAPDIGSRLSVSAGAGAAIVASSTASGFPTMVVANSAGNAQAINASATDAGTGVYGYSERGRGGYFTSASGTGLFVGGSRSIITDIGRSGFGTSNPLEMLDVNGGIKVGNTTGTNPGTIRYNGSDLQGYVGGQWQSLTGGSVTGVWTAAGNDIQNSNSGNVGIGGAAAANSKLNVTGAVANTITATNTAANGNAITAFGIGTNSTGITATSAVGTAGKFSTTSGAAITADGGGTTGKAIIVTQGYAGFGVLNPTEQVDVQGAIRLGSTTNNNPGTIRYNGSDLEGYVSGQWKSLTAAPQTSDWTKTGNHIYSNNTGNVGIGTTSPEAKMDVQTSGLGETSVLGKASSLTSKAVAGTGSAGAYGGYFKSTPASIGTVTALYASSRDGHNAIYTDSGNVVVNRGDVRVRRGDVLVDTGTVSIGTTAPEAKLHVQTTELGETSVLGKASSLTSKAVAGTGSAGAYGGYFKSTPASIGTVTALYASSRDGHNAIYTDSGNVVVNRGDVRVRRGNVLVDTGNVGIGVATPVQKLEVNGAIRIGNTQGGDPGVIRYNNGVFEGYNGSNWVSFGVPLTLPYTGSATAGGSVFSITNNGGGTAVNATATAGTAVNATVTSGTAVNATSTSGVGIQGHSDGAAGVGAGVYGTSSVGTAGLFTTTSGTALQTIGGPVKLGVSGADAGKFLKAMDAEGNAVWDNIPSSGLNLPYTGSAAASMTNAVLDITNTDAGYAVKGDNTASLATIGSAGVYGVVSGSSYGNGVLGRSNGTQGVGVRGTSTGNTGVHGEGKVYGVYGVNENGGGEFGAGGYFTSNNFTGTALQTGQGKVRLGTSYGDERVTINGAIQFFGSSTNATGSAAEGILRYNTTLHQFQWHDGVDWQSISGGGSGGSGWGLSGNSGVSGTNFIGTTSNADVIFKRNNDEGFRMTAGGALLATGNITTGVTPTTTATTRMMWIPAKSAFRAGQASGTEWSNTQIGLSSFAGGNNNTASGTGSFSMGQNNTASGIYSSALGYQNTTDGVSSFTAGDGNIITSGGMWSTALGTLNQTSASHAFAAGNSNTVSGQHGVAMGNNNTASAYSTVAIGDHSRASASAAVAIGNQAVASGPGSYAIGNLVNTNSKTGAWCIGDFSSPTVAMSAQNNNEMNMRFAGGYKLYSDANTTVGAYLMPGSSSWDVISDRRKKENFRTVNGEDFLKSIRNMELTSWNYIGQDAKTRRHYGPMAQDFYAAFGHDGTGTIGNDTTISSSDFDGVNLIAIQALEKRTADLKAENAKLKTDKEQLETKLSVLEAQVTDMVQRVAQLEITRERRTEEELATAGQ